MNKRAKKFILIMVILIAGLLSVNFAFAQGPASNLLFGGQETNVAAELGLGEQDPRVMAASIIRIALGFLGVVALAIIIYAGWLWMTAAGNADKIEKAKKMLIGALIGLAIIMSSFAIVTFILNKLVSATGGGGPGGPGGPPPVIPPGSGIFVANPPFSPSSPPNAIRNPEVRGYFSKNVDAGTATANNFKFYVDSTATTTVTQGNGGPCAWHGDCLSDLCDVGGTNQCVGDYVDGTISVSGKRIKIKRNFDPRIACPAPNNTIACLSSWTQFKIEAVTPGLKSFDNLDLSCGGLNPPCTGTFVTNDLVDVTAPTVNLNITQQYCLDSVNILNTSARDDSGVVQVEYTESGSGAALMSGTGGPAVYSCGAPFAPPCGQAPAWWTLPPMGPTPAQFEWLPTTAAGYTAFTNYTITVTADDMDSNQASDNKTISLKPQHCCNTIMDADETGVDCGGADCDACDGAACATDKAGMPATSCDDNLCASRFCDPTGSTLALCNAAGYSGAASCCLCQSAPIIDWVTPVGGFCNGVAPAYNTPCTVATQAADCAAFGGTCNITTSNGRAGNFVTIGGRYFGAAVGTVDFSDDGGTTWTAASLASAVNPNCTGSWKNDEIIVAVPGGLNAGPGTMIRVTSASTFIDTTQSLDGRGPDFDFVVNTIDRPGLCILNPNNGAMNDPINYQGVRLNGVTAYFGNISSAIIAYSSVFTNNSFGDANVPNLNTGNTSSFVLDPAGITSNYLKFIKNAEPASGPFISDFNPKQGAPGQYVTISGSGFGSSKGSKRVFFNGVEADYSFPAICANSVWSDKQIIVKVPAGGTTGMISVDLVSVTLDTSALTPSNFTVNAALPLLPSLCRISPTTGPNNSGVLLYGEYFGAPVAGVSAARFQLNNDQLYPANILPADWLTPALPTANSIKTTVHPSAVSGLVKVVNGGGNEGNGLNFNVGSCTADADCGPVGAAACCPVGSYKSGQCADDNPALGGNNDGITNVNDCYIAISSSVFDWDFTTKTLAGLGDPCYVSPAATPSCSPLSPACGVGLTCDPATCVCVGSANSCSGYGMSMCTNSLFCPNSPGQCSPYAGGIAVDKGACGNAACSTVGACATTPCTYDSTLNKCVDITTQPVGNIGNCSLASTTRDVLGNVTKATCINYSGTGRWSINTPASCPPGGWVNLPGNQCVLTTETCYLCNSGFTCINDNDGDIEGFCGINKSICTNGSTCNLASNRCEKNDSASCDCCCRIGTPGDCCSGLTCGGDCGTDASGPDTNTYGSCTGCTVDLNSDGLIDDNLLSSVDANFENDSDGDGRANGWFPYTDAPGGINTINQLVSDSAFGGKSQRIVSGGEISGGSNFGGIMMLSVPPLTVGQTYTISFWAKKIAGADNKIYLSNQSGIGDNSCLSFAPTITSTWQRYTKTCVLDFIKPQIYFWSQSPTQEFLIDAIKLESGATAYDINAEQSASDASCNCTGTNGKYCATSEGPDNDGNGMSDGICKDCGSLASSAECTSHSTVCCVDDMSGNACRGGAGDPGLDVPAGLIGYCSYYNGCLGALCDGIASSTGIYNSIPACDTACSNMPIGWGLSCKDESVATTTVCDIAGCSLSCLNNPPALPTPPDNCGICCCDPAAPLDQCTAVSPKLSCTPDKGTCTGATRGMCCGCSQDTDCTAGAPADTIGCGFDTCCWARPKVTTTSPADGDINVCRNAMVKVEFDSLMNIPSFSKNIIMVGDYGASVCPAGTTYILAKKVEKDRGVVANILSRPAKFIKKVISLVSPKAKALTNTFCAVSGTVSGTNSSINGMNNNVSTLSFSPSDVLGANVTYYVIVKGDRDTADNADEGVLSYYEVSMKDAGWQDIDGGGITTSDRIFNGVEFYGEVFKFTTMSDQGPDSGICRIDYVNVSPSSYLFQTTSDDVNEVDNNINSSSFDSARDNDKVFAAEAVSNTGYYLAEIPLVYEWDWLWSSDDTSIVDKDAVNPYAVNVDKQLYAAKAGITDGNTTLRATAQVTGLVAFPGEQYTGTARVWVFMCENPWPPITSGGLWEPWSDRLICSAGPGSSLGLCPVGSVVGAGCPGGTCQTNCNVTAGTLGGCYDTNYEIYYCRDAGSTGTSDDLPAILSDDTVIRGSSTVENILKEFFFLREILPNISSGMGLALADTSTSTAGSLTATWSAIAGATGYKLYYGTSSGNYSNYIDVGNVTTYDVYDLSITQPYYFTVTAYDAQDAESKYSVEVVIDLADSVAPQAPVNLRQINGVACNGQAELEWDANTDDAVGYKVYYGASPGSYGGVQDVGNATSVKLTGLSDITYYFVVTAYDASANESAYSAMLPVTVLDKCNNAIAYWPFESVAGGITPDAVGNDDGTLQGGATQVNGFVGKGMYFDGTNDYINVGNMANLNLGTSNFSVTFWLKTSPSAANEEIISKISAAGTNDGYEVGIRGSGNPYGSFQAAGGTYANNPADGFNLKDDVWHFVAVTVDRGGLITRYVDGAVTGSTMDVSAATYQGSVSTSIPFEIGRRSDANDLYFKGILDELKIYNTALSLTEIQADYNQALAAGAQSMIISQWKFDEGIGTITYDNIGNNDGTLSSGASWDASGRVGSAVSFNGTDGYVAVPDNSNLTLATDFSISMWFKRGLNGFNQDLYSKNGPQVTGALTLGISPTGKLYAVVQMVSVVLTANTSVTDTNWHHVVLTRTPGNVWTIYLDGAQDGTAVNVANPTVNNRNLNFGGEFPPTVFPPVEWPFTGSIDEATIFNRALNSTEVGLLYSSYP